MSLVSLLRERAKEHAARLAYTYLYDTVDGPDASLTYAELDRQAQGVGAQLQSLEAVGQRVLLLCTPGLDYIVGFFGCLYAGAIAVPAYPPRFNRSLSRLESIVTDAEATIGLTTSSIYSKLNAVSYADTKLPKLKWVLLDALNGADPLPWTDLHIQDTNLALLQYTSGSTGNPKGVKLTHANLLHNSELLRTAFEYDSNSRCVSWLPLYHDMGLIGVVLQSLYGCFPCTLMAPAAFLQHPVRWLQAISDNQATLSGGPNFAYELCARKITTEQCANLDLTSWTTAFTGSEPILAETLDRFAGKFGPYGFRGEAFYPCYGLAEATLIVSGCVNRKVATKTVDAEKLLRNQIVPVRRDSEHIRRLVSSGSSLSTQKIIIADPEKRLPRSPGEVGEIWVLGPSVAQGYWNRPNETSETFGAYVAGSGEGPFLRTGDLGFVQDGNLFVTGRLKDLIIIRGLNYYPEDIEITVGQSHAALRSGSGAAFSLTVANEDRLAVVHEVDRRVSPNTEEIIGAIRQAIAEEHEVQVYSVTLIKRHSLPKTSSGKIQRGACRDRLCDGSLAIVAHWQTAVEHDEFESEWLGSASSRDQLQTWLTRELAGRVGLPYSQVDFERPLSWFGLDSIAAMELAHKFEKGFGCSVSVTSFLKEISIRQLVDQLLSTLSKTASQSTASHPPLAARLEYPLSKGQRALWYLYQLSPDSAAFNISAAVRIRSAIDRRALKRTFEKLTERHASLRTVFEVVDYEPVQRVMPEAQLCWEERDVAGWTTELLREQLLEESRRPFDLKHSPPLRVTLYTINVEEHILLLSIHHIVADFWSLNILARDLGILYAAEKDGVSAILPAAESQYSDFVAREEEMLLGIEGERLWSYWSSQLAGELPVLNLPTDRPRSQMQSYRGESRSTRLDVDLVTKLKALGQAEGATLFMVLLAALETLLYRYTGQTDMLIGSLTARRGQSRFAGVVGYLVNPIVLRAKPSGELTFATLLRRVRYTVLAAFEHQDYPFPLLVEKLAPPREPSRPPLIQVMFILQQAHLLKEAGLTAFALGEEGAKMDLGDLPVESISLEQQTAQFDLTLVAAETEAGLQVSLEYNLDLFDGQTVEHILDHFATLLKSIVSNPDQRLNELQLLPDLEQQKVAFDWNATTTRYPKDKCVQELSEAQVQRTPEATAICYRGQQLTYFQLNERANQLAEYLRKAGVGPDVMVGICIERSLEMVVGLLGILKAGGAYVPLDPAYPKERLAYMLDDCGAEFLIGPRDFAQRLPGHDLQVIDLDANWPSIEKEETFDLDHITVPDNLAYVIYTSGSTGRPKGVMVSHRNVSNFFAAMEKELGPADQDVFLAVTSLSFDISVLELLFTLSQGTKIVISGDQTTQEFKSRSVSKTQNERDLDFSLFYFASEDGDSSGDRYRLLLESAKFADRNGFKAVWTPERHFHAFGGLFPNPSVVSAALAAITERIQIRAGSVVLPLHHPLRIAEEWALVDNLSQGRVGIAFASGWHANDFAFFPENYEARKELTFNNLEIVRKLWRGESTKVRGGAGNEFEVKVYPKPVQPELPVWITAAGSVDTFIRAAAIQANVLTHLLGQTLPEVARNIATYRDELTKHGHDPRSGKVTLMLHTFIGEDLDVVRDKVRAPFIGYLRSSIGLIGNLIKSLKLPLDLETMSEHDMNDLLTFVFNRYFETSALFGTVKSTAKMIDELKAIGVNEVACLVDFGVETESVLASLPQLTELKEFSSRPAQKDSYSLADDASRHQVTSMQCTPSMMKLLLLDEENVSRLKSLRTLLLGGEALPFSLVTELKQQLSCRILNMYGPTETTIWSAVHEVDDSDCTVPIGRPVANTQIYILDEALNAVPVGVAGELYIAGVGVARGYHRQSELTAERFISNPFSRDPGTRMYKTGDLARYRRDGTIEFLGRGDQQVKIRGFRIELEEIETVLEEHEQVERAIVLAQQDSTGSERLLAYVVSNRLTPPEATQLLEFLRGKLPHYMVPSSIVMLEALPLTPNGKIDRKALIVRETSPRNVRNNYVPPRNKMEETIASVWQKFLKVEKVGVYDNFFDLGGHSLMVAQIHIELCAILNKKFPLIKLLQYPTISDLANDLAGKAPRQFLLEHSYERARKQRDSLIRQRTQSANVR